MSESSQQHHAFRLIFTNRTDPNALEFIFSKDPTGKDLDFLKDLPGFKGIEKVHSFTPSKYYLDYLKKLKEGQE